MEVNIKIAINEFLVGNSYFLIYDLKYNYIKW